MGDRVFADIFSENPDRGGADREGRAAFLRGRAARQVC
jgi:hypothetical protein